MTKVPMVTLHNGVKMPILGFGVYQIADPEECEQSVMYALKTGYRLLDTAAAYQNEEAVGRAIQRSEVPRGDIFVTTKVWVQDVSYAEAKKAYELSLQKLQLDYVDLLLIHQPYNDVYGAWRAMEELLAEGKVRAIGVSNFASDRLVDLILHNKVVPMVNQVETHPFYQQKDLREVMDEYGVIHEGWAPFAEGREDLFENKILAAIAKKHGKTVGQIVLRWHMQSGIVAIPKSVRKERIEENFDIFDFELSVADMKIIADMDQGVTLFTPHTDPDFVKMLSNAKVH